MVAESGGWAGGLDLRDPMHDIEAEQFLLAAMMLHASAIETAAEIVDPGDFYRPVHEDIFRAMISMYAARVRVDPLTLRTWMEQDRSLRALGERGSVYLADLYGKPAFADSARHYARVVRELAIRRAVEESLHHLGDVIRNRDVTPEDAVSEVEAVLRKAVLGGREQRRTPTVDEFLGMEFPGGEWVVPGLVGRQERVVVVGTEGSGKTTLGHQMAYATAAGVHPFSWRTEIKPQRVLLLDFENPQTLLQRRTRFIAEIAARYRQWDPRNILIHAQPGGADLTDPRQVFELAQVIKRAEPDMIVAGPIYKLVGALNDDQKLTGHRAVAHFFDQARDRFDCAVWLESHAPYAGGPNGQRVMRPEGSNIWAKWPEFGISLLRGSKRAGNDGLEVGQYRGHREEGRTWPAFLTRNTLGGFPWTANYDRETVMA